MSAHHEIETTLLVTSHLASHILAEVAALELIAGYELVPCPDQTLHDCYYDTADGRLRQADLALRLRRSAQACQLAIKGKSQVLQDGRVQRLEVERPCTPAGLDDIWQALAEQGVQLNVGADFHGDRPQQALLSAGLVTIQDRTTERQIRDVDVAVQHGATRRRVGELALDSVAYRFQGNEILHYEIELEGKADDAFPGLDAVIETLRHRYGNAVRLWTPSKVATGRALEQLLVTHGLNELTGGGLQLTPKAYDMIERVLGGKDTT